MKISKRFLLTILLLIVILSIAGVAVFFAKGYRFSSATQTVAGTGIMSVTSMPDQASVYLDGHLTTATNTNINSLPPKTYDVKIVKDGYIPWEKQIQVKEGLVSEVKATLFHSIPTVYPLTYNGISNVVLSPDDTKLLFVVPSDPSDITGKVGGVWVWAMSNNQPLNFGGGVEPHQVALPDGIDYSKAQFRFSPDSSQIMVTLPNQVLLLDETRLNDPPQDITAVAQPTVQSWNDDQKAMDLAKIDSIKDLTLRKTASVSALLSFSPDETHLLYSKDGKTNFTVADLTTNKSYNLPAARSYQWLADSDHLVLVESATPSPAPSKESVINTSPSPSTSPSNFAQTTISVIEFDGGNKDEIYAGNLDPDSVFPWPDGSRVVFVSSFPTPTASEPNLFGVNLK